MTKSDLCADFRELHRSGAPLILANIWDAGSAKVVAESGAKALATSSWAVAAAQGYVDGEKLPLELVITNIERIAAISHLPLTVDFEGGYGETACEIQTSFGELLATAAVGCNLEDGLQGGLGVRAVHNQVSRIELARKAASSTTPGFFINARTDLFLQAPTDRHASEALVAEAIERARAYRQAGADGFFVPGLKDLSVLRTLVEGANLPINVMAGEEALDDYAQLGVARISFGPLTYLKAIAAVSGFAVDRA